LRAYWFDLRMTLQKKLYPDPKLQAAFEAAVAVHWNKLLGIAVAKTNQHDGFDLVQDVLLSAWEKWEEVPKGNELEYYLLHALKLRIFNYYRQTGRYHAHLQKLEALLNDTVDEVAVLAEKELSGLREAILEGAISHLSPRQQQLFTLRIRHQYSYRQIAAILDIDPASARVLYARALEQVKSHIKTNPSLSASLVTAYMLFTIC
jgi:RNA polymerase sigma factor (sigma-70 family)